MRIRLTITIDYEINSEYYPKNATTDEILSIDLASANDDPQQFISLFPYKITGEIIE